MFFSIHRKGEMPQRINNHFYLHEDRWDDWFKYVTMFSAVYIDQDGNNHDLGSVKIGQKEIPDFQSNSHTGKYETIDFLPAKFDKIPDEFFSLGQSDEYYENIKMLGDSLREKILVRLNDVAYNNILYKNIENLDITTTSLMRSISSTAVQGQFNRIAHGGARLTNYDFSYFTPTFQKVNSIKLDFQVIPESNPPSNIHIIIGRNGVGKTHLIRNMIHSLIDNKSEEYGHFEIEGWQSTTFSNIVCVAFSAFDEFPITTTKNNIPYLFVGLKQDYGDKEMHSKMYTVSRLDELKDQFRMSLLNCFANQSKRDRWISAISELETDPVFQESDIRSLDLINNPELESSNNVGRIFNRLSSGHKIILLTITQLVEKVEESTLVILDEPETHLHPPLLSAFIRALSNLLIDRNGVALITTHSPVVLQEVPRNCVWKLWRSDSILKAERPEIETFGENVGSLINEVFGLEVTYSGFHKTLIDAVRRNNGNYEETLRDFDMKLGSEARAILKALIIDYEDDDN